ncbi:MAG: hypothetical protein HY268_28995 [Deltaproteobacteria bacterium]|nr:hypothetical protein [Deltaproteobacteria bacterium]
MSLHRAIELVLACCSKYRLPEPTRQAHLLVNEMRRQAGKKAQEGQQLTL